MPSPSPAGGRIVAGIAIVVVIGVGAWFGSKGASGSTPAAPAADSTLAFADTATFTLRGGVDSFVVTPLDVLDTMTVPSQDLAFSDGGMTPNAIDARLATLLTEAQTGQAERVLRELPPLLSQLSGTQLGEAYYVQMIASSFVQDQDGVCRAAGGVLSMHTAPARIALARRAAQLMSCEGAGT